ncbi:hypothetical protein [uncultured Pontibacter sp.]|uniref:hypothetical protein n=1 Tax=uncultured Pontibacter sp. TaxID=453356 RepID=UPI00263781CD|nr:hypothetical protein [uncultured Pontibacter sp.]
MKMMKKYASALMLGLPLVALGFTSQAQNTKIPAPAQEHILVSENPTENRKETLSGIHLQPAQKGTFLLDFSQELDEDATLEVKNTAGRTVFKKPVSITDNKKAWRYNVGKLPSDTYLVEVKTSDTTYWTKFKVSK